MTSNSLIQAVGSIEMKVRRASIQKGSGSIAALDHAVLLAALRQVEDGPIARVGKRSGILPDFATILLRLGYIASTLKTVRGPAMDQAVAALLITPAGVAALHEMPVSGNEAGMLCRSGAPDAADTDTRCPHVLQHVHRHQVPLPRDLLGRSVARSRRP
jgi:hypothetical protein